MQNILPKSGCAGALIAKSCRTVMVCDGAVWGPPCPGLYLSGSRWAPYARQWQRLPGGGGGGGGGGSHPDSAP